MRAELQRNITKTPPKCLCHPGAIGQKNDESEAMARGNDENKG